MRTPRTWASLHSAQGTGHSYRTSTVWWERAGQPGTAVWSCGTRAATDVVVNVLGAREQEKRIGDVNLYILCLIQNLQNIISTYN